MRSAFVPIKSELKITDEAFFETKTLAFIKRVTNKLPDLSGIKSMLLMIPIRNPFIKTGFDFTKPSTLE
jgi:hypothetical protein